MASSANIAISEGDHITICEQQPNEHAQKRLQLPHDQFLTTWLEFLDSQQRKGVQRELWDDLGEAYCAEMLQWKAQHGGRDALPMTIEKLILWKETKDRLPKAGGKALLRMEDSEGKRGNSRNEGANKYGVSAVVVPWWHANNRRWHPNNCQALSGLPSQREKFIDHWGSNFEMLKRSRSTSLEQWREAESSYVDEVQGCQKSRCGEGFPNTVSRLVAEYESLKTTAASPAKVDSSSTPGYQRHQHYDKLKPVTSSATQCNPMKDSKVVPYQQYGVGYWFEESKDRKAVPRWKVVEDQEKLKDREDQLLGELDAIINIKPRTPVLSVFKARLANGVEWAKRAVFKRNFHSGCGDRAKAWFWMTGIKAFLEGKFGKPTISMLWTLFKFWPSLESWAPFSRKDRYKTGNASGDDK